MRIIQRINLTRSNSNCFITDNHVKIGRGRYKSTRAEVTTPNKFFRTFHKLRQQWGSVLKSYKHTPVTQKQKHCGECRSMRAPCKHMSENRERLWQLVVTVTWSRKLLHVWEMQVDYSSTTRTTQQLRLLRAVTARLTAAFTEDKKAEKRIRVGHKMPLHVVMFF